MVSICQVGAHYVLAVGSARRISLTQLNLYSPAHSNELVITTTVALLHGTHSTLQRFVEPYARRRDAQLSVRRQQV